MDPSCGSGSSFLKSLLWLTPISFCSPAKILCFYFIKITVIRYGTIFHALFTLVFLNFPLLESGDPEEKWLRIPGSGSTALPHTTWILSLFFRLWSWPDPSWTRRWLLPSRPALILEVREREVQFNGPQKRENHRDGRSSSQDQNIVESSYVKLKIFIKTLFKMCRVWTTKFKYRTFMIFCIMDVVVETLKRFLVAHWWQNNFCW